jgi:hypothetical protein
MSESSSQPWAWPPDHVLTLYHWSWFDRAAGDVIVGWSQCQMTDDSDYIHLEAETISPTRSVQVDFDGSPIIEVHTFTSFTPLPTMLREGDGRPLAWILALLGEV